MDDRFVQALLAHEPRAFHAADRLWAHMAHTWEPTQITPRQAQILDRLCQGHTYHEIAHQLHLSHHTVHDHARKAFKRLGARNRMHAAALWEREYKKYGTPKN